MSFIKNMTIVGIMSGVCALVSTPTIAAEGEALLAGKSCVACHTVDKKIVGPAFKEIAAKYKGHDGAKAILVAKIKSGGAGNWGQMPMPPSPTVSDDELNKIVEWILAL